MDYYEALKFINNTNVFGSKLGLETISGLLNILGNPQEDVKAIHVAGTNGKGSTSSFIHSILKTAGYKTGLYISPSLEEINDRISINGVRISDKDFTDLAETVSTAIEKMVKEGYQHPTEFEVVTAMAFLYFKQQKVDFVVLEVGLGGRLDATNICNPILSVITSISFDHTDYLGDTLAKIAVEKGGIIKPGIPTVLYRQSEEVEQTINTICEERKSDIYYNDSVDCEILEVELGKQKMKLRFDNSVYEVESSLVGKHQCENLKTALTAIQVLMSRGLRIDNEEIIKGIKDNFWPGRLEVIMENPKVVLDGAHNLDGAISLKNSLECTSKNKNKVLIFGMLADKDIEGVVKELAPLFEQAIITVPNSNRAENPHKVKEVFERYGVKTAVEEDIELAVDKGISYNADLTVIAGSLYLIGDVRKYIKNKKGEK